MYFGFSVFSQEVNVIMPLIFTQLNDIFCCPSLVYCDIEFVNKNTSGEVFNIHGFLPRNNAF